MSGQLCPLIGPQNDPRKPELPYANAASYDEIIESSSKPQMNLEDF